VLAIVRFRTVMEDTRDTGFVIFAVAVGMAVGAGYLTIALLGFPFAAAAAFLFRPRAAGRPAVSSDFTLGVRLGIGYDPEAVLRESFSKHLERSRLLTAATARQGAALELTYDVRLRRADGAIALLTELNGIEGVQGIELRPA
jgi:hypothetical protein